jgi:hypothetical protein
MERPFLLYTPSPASRVTHQNYGNKMINSFKLKPPFLFPPRGKGFFAPSPLGEGWEGGSLIKKITLKAQNRNSINCYMNCEEIHSRRALPPLGEMSRSDRGVSHAKQKRDTQWHVPFQQFLLNSINRTYISYQ